MTIICEPVAQLAGVLADAIDGDALRTGTPRAVLAAIAADPAESVVVLGPGLRLEQALRLTSRLRDEHPYVGVVVVRDTVPARTIGRAIAAGAREVAATADTFGIAAACRRLRQARIAPVTGPAARHGRILTVLAAKGGCGKTTLATNLAVVLSARGTRQVCMVDLDLDFGDVASTLALEPGRSLVDVPDAAPMDAATIGRLITPYRPGLDCILAPARPGDAAKVPATRVGELLAALPSLYHYVVVDTPAQFSAHVLAALDSAHHHVLLTTPEKPALKNLRLTLDMLDLLSYGRGSRSIVLNRSDSRVGLAADDVEELVRTPVAGHLPSRWDVPASINAGVPLATDPGHVVSRAVQRYADEHLTVWHPEPVEATGSDLDLRWWSW